MKLTLAMLVIALLAVACSQTKSTSKEDAQIEKCCTKVRLLY